MNLTEITYAKIKYVIEIFYENKETLFFIGEGEDKTRRNSGRSMLNQSKEVLCICVSF